MAALATLLPGLLTGLGGLAGLFGSPKEENSSTQSKSQTNTWNSSQSDFSQQLKTLLDTLSTISGSTTQTGSTQQTLSPGGQGLADVLTKSAGGLAKPVDLSGYAAQQSEAINRSSSLQSKAADNIMASRGLSYSPASGATAANIDAQRFAAQTNLQESLPLIQNQLQTQNLGAAAGILSALPRGTTSTQSGTTLQQGQTTQSGTNLTSGNQSTNTQGSQYGATNSNTTSTGSSGGGLGGLFGGLGSVLASLFLKKP